MLTVLQRLQLQYLHIKLQDLFLLPISKPFTSASYIVINGKYFVLNFTRAETPITFTYFGPMQHLDN